MDAATARFFDIPELVDILVSQLAKSDVATLVRTCRHFKALFEPWLYRDLSLCSSSERDHRLFAKNGGLFQSIFSVRALSRNSHHVRKLNCWLPEVVYFFNCLLRHQTQTTTSTAFAVDQPESTTSPTLPRWVPSLTVPPPRCRLTPLAPMNNLVHLRMNFRPSRYKSELRYRMSTCKFATATAARQVCWIIQQSPHITHLQLYELSVSSLREMELLAVTFHGLHWLQEIRLAICADEEVWQRGFYKVFFALPVSVRVCKMVGKAPLDYWCFLDDTDPWSCEVKESEEEGELDTEDDDESSSSSSSRSSRQHTSDNKGSVEAIQEENQVSEERGQELAIPEVFCRSRPLSQLKKFQAWDMSTLTNEEFLAVFHHCSNVNNLRVPPVSENEEDLENIARSISERCPHLRWLSSKETNAALVTAIMEVMSNQHQIEEVKVVYNRCHIDIGAVRRALARHSTALCKVDFHNTFIRSMDLLAILEHCESLEILILYPDSCGRPFITLADAISVPWACKRIRHLELSIGLEHVALSSMDLPYYQRPAPVTLSEEEKRQFADLEILYREIGSLVNVEYLDLRGTYMDDEGERMDELNEELDAFTFPGMLALRDGETGRPGYLDLLSGLVKLKELHGTVRVTTNEAKATVGDREMKWISSHWPALERVAFFASDQVVTAPFRQLRDTLRPGLSLSQFNLVDREFALFAYWD